MYFLIALIILSQIFIFYKLFKPKGKSIPVDSIILTPIPKKIFYGDIDKDHSTVYDVMESAKREDWEFEVEADLSKWSITIKSNYGLVINSRIRESYVNKNIELSVLRISFLGPDSSGVNISSPISTISHSIFIYNDSVIKNDIILFLWSYVIKHHNNINEDETKKIKKDIEFLSSKLKTLNRSRRLDEILN